MEVLPISAMFVVLGTHVTENLEHHKANDVKRILEEKGFTESSVKGPDSLVHFYTHGDEKYDGKRTIIIFGEGGFVQAEDGVRFYESA